MSDDGYGGGGDDYDYEGPRYVLIPKSSTMNFSICYPSFNDPAFVRTWRITLQLTF